MRKLIIIGAMLLLSQISGALAAATGPALDPNDIRQRSPSERISGPSTGPAPLRNAADFAAMR